MIKATERRYLEGATLVFVRMGSTKLNVLIGERHYFSLQLVGGCSPAQKRYRMFYVLSNIKSMKFDHKHKSSVRV